MGLRFKFNLVMIAVLGLAVIALAIPTRRPATRQAHDQVIIEAALMMRGADAANDYTKAEIAPLLAGRMDLLFLPQSVPFHASQQMLKRVCTATPGCAGFREAALNPTDPTDRALPWEANVIARFRARPALRTLVTERQTDRGAVLSYAEPIYVEEGSCLACHSKPSVAPASMVDVYGSANGFGWKIGDLAGVNIVSMVESTAPQAAWPGRLLPMGVAACAVGLLVAVNLCLYRFVVAPIRKMTAVATAVSLGSTDVAELDLPSKDEIGSLAASFNRMRRSLDAAIRMLEE